MLGLFILFGMTFGAAIALLLNKLVADKIVNKHSRLGIKITAYVVLVILGLFLGLVCSIKSSLNKFINGKINAVEITLNKHFPDEKVMDISINANDFSTIVNQLQQSLIDINTGTDSFLEKLVFKAFIDRVNGYIDDIHSGINAVGTRMGNIQGEITLRSILYNLKDLALNKITPYLVFFIILIIISFLIFIGIYLGVVKLLKKDRHG